MKKLLLIISTTSGLMAGVWDWIKIIGDIIGLIFANPGNIYEQVDIVSDKHDVPRCEIWRHGGFGYDDEIPIE